MSGIRVLDARGQSLSPCSPERADALTALGKADWVCDSPPTIRLHQAVDLPTRDPSPPHPLYGQRMLLHVCCAPCATFTVDHLRAVGADLTGYWYNPNVHPFSEHERRQDTLADYTRAISLPVVWEPGYEMPAFLRQVSGHERHGERCARCYRMRLEQTARRAAEAGYQAFGTTLTISPYQNLQAIQRIGQALQATYGVAFYGENLRRGYAESRRLASANDLYQQRFCGCLYSEWESLSRDARPAADLGKTA